MGRLIERSGISIMSQVVAVNHCGIGWGEDTLEGRLDLGYRMIAR